MAALAHRYERNIGTITQEENEKLRSCSVCVAGCGGLGGYIIEGLARMGVGTITAVDGDVFQPSNLNRQLLSTEREMGYYKALAAQERVRIVNSETRLHPLCCYITKENAEKIITEQYDAVVDALDNIPGRRLLEASCEKRGIPLIHGAIAGWQGQVTVIMPGDSSFDNLYPEGTDKGVETETGNPFFTPAVIGAIQVAETIKVLIGRKEILRKKLLTVDLLEQEFDLIRL